MSVAAEEFCGTQLPAVESLARALKGNSYWAVRQLTCESLADQIVVRGKVPSYYLRQIAEALVAKAKGRACVQCEIAVRPE